MKKIILIAGFLLGVAVIVLYEVSIYLNLEDKKKAELEMFADLFRVSVENSFANNISQLEKLSSVIRVNRSINSSIFQEYSREISENSLLLAIQFSDYKTKNQLVFSQDDQVENMLKERKVEPSGVGTSYYLRKALEADGVVCEGPKQELAAVGGSRIILPLFSKSQFLGVLAGYINLSSIFNEAVPENYKDNFSFNITNDLGKIIVGEDEEFELSLTRQVNIGASKWYLTIWPHNTGLRQQLEKRIVLPVCAFLLVFISAAIYFYFYRTIGRFENIVKEQDDEMVTLRERVASRVKMSQDTQRDLARSEERYRALFDNNPIQTIVVDTHCRIVMYNFARKKVAGRLPVIGELMYRDYAEQHEIDMFSELVYCIESGKQKEFPELRYKERFLRIHISPYSEGAIITSIDITATKKLFDQLQHSHKMEAVGTLAGGIAHEFNNIIGIILGNVELVVDETQENEMIRENLLEIQSASLRAKEVVSQLMSFSQKKQKVKKPEVISAIIENSLNTLVRASIPATINIVTSIQKDIPMVMVNSSQIQQVIVNLCSNAALAIEGEQGVIRIELREITLSHDRGQEYQNISPGKYVQLVVSDNGKGMEVAILEKIFDPYFTTREVGQGTGMGLAFVHGIVVDHGAEILVHSEEGKGTTIKILFQPLIGHTPLTT